MKRAFFLLTCLWVMCNLCRAQDIFTSGYYLDASGFKAAAVFKNDAIVYQRSESGLVRKETAGFDRIIDVRGLPTGLYWVQCGRKGVPFVKE